MRGGEREGESVTMTTGKKGKEKKYDYSYLRDPERRKRRWDDKHVT